MSGLFSIVHGKNLLYTITPLDVVLNEYLIHDPVESENEIQTHVECFLLNPTSEVELLSDGLFNRFGKLCLVAPQLYD